MATVQRFPRGRFNAFHNALCTWQVGVFLLVILIPALWQTLTLSVEELWIPDKVRWIFFGVCLSVIPVSVILMTTAYVITHHTQVVWEFRGQQHDFRTFLVIFLIEGTLHGVVWGFLLSPGLGIVGSLSSMYLFLSFYWNGGIWYHDAKLLGRLNYSRFQYQARTFFDRLAGEASHNLPYCMIWTVIFDSVIYGIAVYGIHS